MSTLSSRSLMKRPHGKLGLRVIFEVGMRAMLTFLPLAMLVVTGTTARAGQVGEILACYACQNTGNSAIDAALALNPGVASDGLLFAFVNTSSFDITGGVFAVTNATPNDSFMLPTIVAGATFILIPGVTSDGGTHAAGGLFGATGVMDTSDGVGGLSDASVFSFTGLSNAQGVTSTTAGTSTGTPGTFTPGDPGLFKPWIVPASGGSTSFIGLGPNGDGGCTNCYFGEVATLNTPSATVTPEPAGFGLGLAGLTTLIYMVRRGLVNRAGLR